MTDPAPNRFHYDAIIKRVIDGDTVVADIDLGLGIWRKGEVLRLHGINTPEVVGANKAAGLEAKAALEDLFDDGAPGVVHGTTRVVIQTFKDGDDKFGRLLARIHVAHTETWLCVNDELLARGHAKPWDGKGTKPT
jgi:micrococcal nuclease